MGFKYNYRPLYRNICDSYRGMSVLKSNPSVILLVEDDDGHATLTMRALEKAGVPNKIYWVIDGEEALDYLFRKAKYVEEGTSPRPDLILLDLRLPKLDGHNVLKEIKKTAELKYIPVVVFTTSKSDTDILQAYTNYVNSYLVKPADFDEFYRMIHALGCYWLKWNRTPKLKEA